MDLLAYYPHLKGSYGQVRLQVRQGTLDLLCIVLEKLIPDQVTWIRVAPNDKNRFSIFAELSNTLFTWLGSLFLNVLGDTGIEIKLEETTAVPGTPFRGKLMTTMVGQGVVTKIVNAINQKLEVGNVLQVNSELFGVTRLTLDPFPLLQRYLPAGIGHHLTLVKWQTTRDSFFLDFNWQHAG